MKFSTVAVPALLGLASAQDITFEEKREAEPIGPLGLIGLGSLAIPVVQKLFGKRDLSSLNANELEILNKLSARDIQLDADDLKILSALQRRDAEADPIGPLGLIGLGSLAIPVVQKLFGKRDVSELNADELQILSALQARDAAVGPGALALISGAAFPVANWLLEKVAGPGKQAKRSIELDDEDLQILQSLQARDAAVGPGALALISGAAYPVANWLLEKVAGPGKQAKRSLELNDDDIEFLQSLQRRDAAVGPGALALISGAAFPVANWLLEKVAGPGKQAKRSIELDDEDLQILQSLQARDAAVGPGALALISGAAYPVANWLLEKIAGPGKQAKRDLTAADIDELNTLFARDAAIGPVGLAVGSGAFGAGVNWLMQRISPSSEKRDLTAADIDELNSILARDLTDAELNTIFARDAAIGPVGLAVGSGAFGVGVNWLLQRLSPSSKKRDLSAADIEELNSILARDLSEDELPIFARDAAIGPVGLAVGSGAFGAAVNWIMQRVSPSSKRSIAEFAPMVRRDNLVFKPVQFAA
ncbi:uncharacterized protein RHO25_007177 [Cercospora beticola]|uniref:Uncharacterized protein n=1 Tax=Cercospora beticola TaxID=122368 RepID=A0ABZ0NST5_CERBT|nr:hypothetical protein RHO25_007177 [Cercospora beticola]CAK1362566.1 unnamed protein product [Cercospora beticola]